MSVTQATAKSGTATFTVTGVTPPAGRPHDPSNKVETSRSIFVSRLAQFRESRKEAPSDLMNVFLPQLIGPGKRSR